MSEEHLDNVVASHLIKSKEMTKRISAFIVERRQKKRCPKCDFFIVTIVILISSLSLISLFNLFPGLINKTDFQVVSASSFEQDNSIAIDADLKMNFPDEVVEALENGIPLTIAVDVQVLRERPWWRNIIIKESRQRFELRYHPLTNVHEVKNLATNERYTFNSRHDAMAVLGTIRGAQLIEKKELSSVKIYYAKMRILLDINRLPLALRQVASLSSSWRVESPWFLWEIKSGEIKDKSSAQTQGDGEELSDFVLELKKRSKRQEPIQDASQVQSQPQSEIENNAPDKISGGSVSEARP